MQNSQANAPLLEDNDKHESNDESDNSSTHAEGDISKNIDSGEPTTPAAGLTTEDDSSTYAI